MKNMDKLIAKLMPILLLMMLLASCGRGDDHKSYDTVKLLHGENYYYEGSFYDGSDLDGYTIKLAVRGPEFVIAFSDKSGTELGRSLKLDGIGYYIDNVAKKYTRDTYYDEVTFSYSDLEFVESGTSKINALAGVEDDALYFEKYATTYDAEKGVLYFYFKADQLYAIQEDFTDATGVAISEVVVINKISSEIPKDWFAIPEDYSEI